MVVLLRRLWLLWHCLIVCQAANVLMFSTHLLLSALGASALQICSTQESKTLACSLVPHVQRWTVHFNISTPYCWSASVCWTLYSEDHQQWKYWSPLYLMCQTTEHKITEPLIDENWTSYSHVLSIELGVEEVLLHCQVMQRLAKVTLTQLRCSLSAVLVLLCASTLLWCVLVDAFWRRRHWWLIVLFQGLVVLLCFASQDAPEVIVVTHSLSVSTGLTLWWCFCCAAVFGCCWFWRQHHWCLVLLQRQQCTAMPAAGSCKVKWGDTAVTRLAQKVKQQQQQFLLNSNFKKKLYSALQYRLVKSVTKAAEA